VREAGLPVFHRVETAVRAIGFALDHAARVEAARARRTAPVRRRVAPPPEGASDFEALEWLRGQGVSVAPGQQAKTADEAVAAAEALGYPVALKVVSRDVPHKTEVGALRLDLASASAVRKAWTAIVGNVRRHRADAVIDGLMVQKMVKGNTEAIVGLKRDPRFGWAVMVGLGGIFTEVLGDVSVRLAPVTAEEAEEMIRELRGVKLLEGARGRARADVGALGRLVSELSVIAASLPEAASELDLNPVLVMDAGQGVVCVDALLVQRPG
jgi:acyl-CoA synthetase (NDP forming)